MCIGVPLIIIIIITKFKIIVLRNARIANETKVIKNK